MRNQRAELSYLRKMMSLLQARLVMTPEDQVISFDHSDDCQLVFTSMKSKNIDYAPILRDGAFVGYVSRRSLVDIVQKTCGELAKEATVRNIISPKFSLENVLKRLVDEPFLFVTENKCVKGIITRADVNKRAFRTLFYIVLSELESQLVNLIRTMLPCEKSLHLLSEERAKDVLYSYWKAKTGNVEISVEQYLSFSDLVNIVLKSKDMIVWSLLRFTSRKQAENLSSLVDLRNNVMHSTRSLLVREDSIQRILQRYEQIWELLESLLEFEELDEDDIVSLVFDRKNQDFRFVLKSGAVIRTPLDDINGRELETVGIEKIRKFLESSYGKKKTDKTTMKQLESTVVFNIVFRRLVA